MYKQITIHEGRQHERFITDATCVVLLTKMISRQHRDGSYAEFTFSQDRGIIEINWGDATRHITTKFIHTPESWDRDEDMVEALEALDNLRTYPCLGTTEGRYIKAKKALTTEQQAEITLYE